MIKIIKLYYLDNIAIHAPLKVKSMARVTLNLLSVSNGNADEKGPTTFVPNNLMFVCCRNCDLHLKLVNR